MALSGRSAIADAAGGRAQGDPMSRQSSQSAERCLDILELLLAEHGPIGVSDIAKRLALPLSATHRLVQVLVDKGYAEQRSSSGLYAPTMRVAVLGLRFLGEQEVVQLSQPVLDALAAETRELVRMAVVDGGSMIWVAKAQGSTASIRHDPINGRQVPLHTTAMGKAWLAAIPEEEAVSRVERTGFRAELTGPNAIRDAAALRAELARVRAAGYAFALQESELGLCAVAMVIRDRTTARNVVGAVSVAGPSFRVDERVLEGFVPSLRRAVAAIERIWPNG
jgi:IclR family acetate operon transcriptional repressor